MKKIALQVDLNEDHSRPLFNLAYYKFAELLCDTFPDQLNGITLITPFEEQIDPNIGLFLGIGGADLNPLKFGKKRVPWLVGHQNSNFEYFDCTLLPKLLLSGIPSVHVCRSMQAVNVFFWGSLHLHVEEPTSKNRSDLAHFGRDTRTGEVIGLTSLHHQAVDKLGNDLDIILQGFSINKKKKEVSLQVEGIRHKSLPILGLQMHPEELDITKEYPAKSMRWVLNEIASVLEQGKNQEVNLNPENNVGRHFV